MVKTMKKVFSILTVLCIMMGILSITAFAAVSLPKNPKVEFTSDPVIIGGENSKGIFFVAVKQARTYSCWTAVDVTGDTTAQGQIEAAVLAADGKGQAKNAWEFHYFDLSLLGQSFYVFNNSSDSQYSGMAVINYDTTNKELTFQMANSDKWSHLIYGTYTPDSVPPQTGSLTITKAIGDGNAYANAASDTYSFTITGTDGTAGNTYAWKDSNDDISFVTFDGQTNTASLDNVAVNTPITITGLPAGQYTVAETSAPAPGGYTLSTSYTDSDTAEGTNTSDRVVNLTLGGTAAAPAISNGAITITNTYTASVIPPVTPQTGSLTITKTLGHDNAYTSAATDSEYSVDVTIASNTDDTKGQTYSLADSTASVTFDGTTNQVVLSGVKVDTPITITGLPAGQYTVAETSAPAPGGYTLSTSYTDSDTAEGTSTSDRVVNLTLGGTAAAPAISNGAITITNTYTASVIPPVTPQTGSLTITKTLGHDNAYTSAATDSEYSVDVTIASNTDDTKGQTYSLADSTASVTFDGTTNQVVLSGVKVDTPITITGLPAGQYTVAETSAPAPGRYTLSTSYTDSDTAEGTSTSDRVVTLSQVETDNGFAVSNGTMTITNTYTANGGGGGSETPSNPAPTTPVEITETTTPLGEVPAEATEPTEEIADEPVALASVPQTGDTSALWFTLSGLSAVGLAGVYVLGRKRRDDSIQ